MELLNNYYSKHLYNDRITIRHRILSEKLNSHRQCHAEREIKKYLDIGCANGGHTLLARDLLSITNGNVYGVDISEIQVKESILKGINARLYDANVDKLPFEDNYFDYITNISFIEHILNVELHVSEMYRVLKPNGLLGIITPNLGSYINIFSLLLGYQPHKVDTALEFTHGHLSFKKNNYSRSHGHLRVYSKMGLIKLLEYHKFKKLDYFGVKHHSYSNDMIHNLMSGFETILQKTFPHYCYELGLIVTK